MPSEALRRLWVECADDYLAGLGCILWPGVAFDLTDEKERVKAARWLADTIGAVTDGT